MLKAPADIKRFLPYGEMLRGFIEQSVIAKSDLSRLLKSRGVFTDSTEKDATIPILTSTILSPDEFDVLLDCYKLKEDNPKTITQTIPWRSDDSLLEHLPEDILSNFESELEFSNYKLSAASDFVPIWDDNDHLKLDFEIERTDTSKSWCESTNFFPGSVELKKITEGDSVKLAITYTAKETLNVARKTTGRVIKHFKEVGQLANDDTVRRVLFSSFSNAARVRFLLSLTVQNPSLDLTFRDVVDISIAPDASLGDLPESLSWIEQRIRDFRCKGKSLHEAAFVGNDECHDYIMMYSIDAAFDFDIKGAVGSCRVSMSFPKFGNKGDVNSELEVNVQDVRIESGAAEVKASLLRKLISDELQDLVVQQFSESTADASGVS